MKTITMLVNLLAQVSCQENQSLSIHASRHGYAVVDSAGNTIIPADDSISSLYESLEQRYYSNMYTCFNN